MTGAESRYTLAQLADAPMLGAGVDPELVRECNCDRCAEKWDQITAWAEAQSQGDATLNASEWAGGGAPADD
jgi:hypothetical protein